MAPAGIFSRIPKHVRAKKAKFRNLNAEQLVALTRSLERTVAGLQSKTFKPARARPANVAPVMTSKWLA
jgi:hypothetical protein